MTIGDLAEGGRLIEGVAGFAEELRADHIVLLGDLFDTMSHVRLEVMAFWRDAIRRARRSSAGSTIVLVGNHDRSNDGLEHALWPYGQGEEATIIDAPQILQGVLFLPHMADPAEFVRLCRAHPTRTVVCHQTFDGAQYENGFYAGADAVDPAAIPQDQVISGHIHKPGRYGKVWYVGAPRWRTASDANEERAVWCVDHAPDGSIVAAVPRDTARWCRRIVQLEATPESWPDVPAPGPLVDVRVAVRGPGAFVQDALARLAAQGVTRVSSVRTDALVPSVRESEGVGRAWGRFVEAYAGEHGTPAARVRARAADDYGLVAA